MLDLQLLLRILPGVHDIKASDLQQAETVKPVDQIPKPIFA